MATEERRELGILYVLGVPLHVILDPDPTVDGEKCQGIWADDEASLIVRTSGPDRVLILFHEVCHAATDLLSLPKDWQNDEETRSSVFSVLVTGIMRDPRNRRVLRKLE
jgi:hypothetical protein